MRKQPVRQVPEACNQEEPCRPSENFDQKNRQHLSVQNISKCIIEDHVFDTLDTFNSCRCLWSGLKYTPKGRTPVERVEMLKCDESNAKSKRDDPTSTRCSARPPHGGSGCNAEPMKT